MTLDQLKKLAADHGPKIKDYSGQKFYRLTIIKPFRDKRNNIGWDAMCDCGKKVRLTGGSMAMLRRGELKSCSCSRIDKLTKHKGWTNREQLYTVWRSMRNRCNTVSNSSYRHYGGRGIKICKKWDAYAEFREWALANGYKLGLTIDRKNNDGNYSPRNCRWVTKADNNRNRVHWMHK